MTEHFDRIVIGGGAMGLATTWHLATRGQRVLMLERFSPGHTRGASHGATRNMNNAYSDAHYLDLYDEALGLWRELEAASGRQLLTLSGLVTHGVAEAVEAAHDALVSRGAAAELIAPEEATERYPGMRFDGAVLVTRDAGRIHAAEALRVLAALAREAGADLRYGHRAVGIDPDREGVAVTAEGPDGVPVRYRADGAVVAVGAWSSQLLAGIVELPKLTVTEEHPAHFAPRPASRDAAWPSFNHYRPATEIGSTYGMLTPGEGVKVGFHGIGPEVDPDRRPFRGSEAARAGLRDYVAEWFPGLDPDSAAEISCTYTSTESARFVLDRRDLVTVAAGFSGHGFKFVPAIGRVLADATLGVSSPPGAFRIEAH